MQYVTMSNGKKMPQLGYGCAAINEFGDGSDSVREVIEEAIQVGYRHLDTASIYNTEKVVGQAVANSGIPREDFFVTTKLAMDDMEYDKAMKAMEVSLNNLGMDYVDLYLIHWPIKTTYLDAWKALEQIYEQGMAKAIGGSNFALRHFEGIASTRNVKPMVNQVELHPYFQQKEMRAYCAQENVTVTAWSPLGTGNWSQAKADDKPLTSPIIATLAQKHSKTPAQIILRWIMEMGVSTIPKTQNRTRMEGNLNIFDFSLSTEDLETIEKADKNLSIGTAFVPANQALMDQT